MTYIFRVIVYDNLLKNIDALTQGLVFHYNYLESSISQIFCTQHAS